MKSLAITFGALSCLSVVASLEPATAQQPKYHCKQGDKVSIDQKWRMEGDATGSGVVTEASESGVDCKVRLSDGRERQYIMWQLRPAGAKQMALPAALPVGVYTCFASVPRYTGSSYVSGVGSVAQYSFTWQRQGTMSFGRGTWSGGPGGSGRVAYSNGQLRWSGGSLDGKTSTASINGSGKLEVAVPVTGHGKVDRWQCSPGNGR